MKITIISFSSAMSEMLQRELMAYFDLEALWNAFPYFSMIIFS
jgi:hypothetical protein